MSVFVGNLPFSVTEDDIRTLFEPFGHLETVNLAKNHTGVSKGFATLVFREPQAATDAISELNGHELSGRTLLVKSDSKPTREESRLYVGNIPYRTAWQDLKDLFRDAGYVTRVEIPSDASGKAKGFAIVTMASNEESKKAIELFNGYEWNGRSLQVREDRNEIGHSVGYSPSRIYHSAASGRQLFVGRIPFRMHWQDLKDLFKEAGEVVRAEVAFDETGKSKGFGQVIMASKNDAENAIRLLNGREVEGRAIEVREDKFAHESAFSVFVGNLSYSVKWQDLKDVFKTFDLYPTHVDIAMENQRSKGYGLVKFSSKEEADKAIQQVNGTDLFGRPLLIKQDKFQA